MCTQPTYCAKNPSTFIIFPIKLKLFQNEPIRNLLKCDVTSIIPYLNYNCMIKLTVKAFEN